MTRRILIIEPYYGGSHKLFLKGLQKTVTADYTLLTLPARKWKMRMQLSAIWFVQKIKEIPLAQRCFDTVLCSTFVDVAVLRSLLIAVPGWNPEARVVTYYHENQFAYPGQTADPTIRQFTAINFTTALASDCCAFNSKYNMESFLGAIEFSLKRVTDMTLLSCVAEIRKKSEVLYPGMDYLSIDNAVSARSKKVNNAPLVIAWNHRWEHDKGPELFFEALMFLQKKGIDFSLIVLGQSFAKQPDCFKDAAIRFKDEIIHFGYAESRDTYSQLLHQADVIVSTARHEFFGISMLEGIRAGCYPLLPADLSYPELYEKQYQYTPGKLGKSLLEFMRSPMQLTEQAVDILTSRFSWIKLEKQYENFLFGTKQES